MTQCSKSSWKKAFLHLQVRFPDESAKQNAHKLVVKEARGTSNSRHSRNSTIFYYNGATAREKDDIKRGYRCYKRLKAKTGGSKNLSHTRWIGGSGKWTGGERFGECASVKR